MQTILAWRTGPSSYFPCNFSHKKYTNYYFSKNKKKCASNNFHSLACNLSKLATAPNKQQQTVLAHPPQIPITSNSIQFLLVSKQMSMKNGDHTIPSHRMMCVFARGGGGWHHVGFVVALITASKTSESERQTANSKNVGCCCCCCYLVGIETAKRIFAQERPMWAVSTHDTTKANGYPLFRAKLFRLITFSPNFLFTLFQIANK